MLYVLRTGFGIGGKGVKRIFISILLGFICVTASGCAENQNTLSDNVNQLKTEITHLEAEKQLPSNEVFEIKAAPNTAKYIITFSIRQVHYTLSISQHIKDELNEITIQIPVDKGYYDSVKVGTVINEDFRVGSMIMKGSFGKWKVTVADKEIR